MLGADTRYSLAGDRAGLRVVAETGDREVPASGGRAVFLAVGHDPYELTARAARSVVRQQGTCRLRLEKSLPDFVDWFGWCTWDAFYQEVSAEKVLAGLASFERGGVRPRFLIIDDGWQSVAQAGTGEVRLTGFSANRRFPGGLAPVVHAAKTEYGVKRLLVWHALLGYWGGVAGESLPGYGTRTVVRHFGPAIAALEADWNSHPWGAAAGVPAAHEVGRFFDDYHRSMVEQGVDGVKVDNQATLEAVSSGQQGRVVLARAFRAALEDSAARHFGDRLINCMSVTTECVYLATRSVLMRTSDDFWPRRPESHGKHLYTNAQAALWFGEFMLPDWDMFQSEHAAGAYHAAARAVSGGAIYVSDEPGAHNFDLLRKLVLSDGSVLRPDSIGRPTPDCLFVDPTREDVLLKIFNTNRDCGMVGIFNARHAGSDTAAPLQAGVSAADVPTLPPADFVAFAHRANALLPLPNGKAVTVALGEGEWEIVSLAPIEHGFAVLGLADKFNSTGAVTAREWSGDRRCRISLREGGTFLAWTEIPLTAAWCDGALISFRHDPDGRLEIDVPPGAARELMVQWA